MPKWMHIIFAPSQFTCCCYLLLLSTMTSDERSRAMQRLSLLLARNRRDVDSIPCEIEEGLFLGSISAAQNKDALKVLNVTHVLIVARSLVPAYPDDFVYKKIEVLDSSHENLKQHFQDCFNFIDSAKKDGSGVLVHCFAGLSRSVTIVIAYLMKKHTMSFSEAMAMVRSKRPQVCPNNGFVLQLKEYESSILGS